MVTIEQRLVALEQAINADARIVPEVIILEDGRVMLNHGGLILPPSMTTEEWVAAAMTQQAELCGRIAHAKLWGSSAGAKTTQPQIMPRAAAVLSVRAGRHSNTQASRTDCAGRKARPPGECDSLRMR